MRTAGRCGVVVLGILLLLGTAARITAWRGSERAHWQRAIAHSPEKPRPWVNYGAQLARAGDAGGAARAYREAVRLADTPDRRRVEGPQRIAHVALWNLALLHVARGEYADALRLTAQIQPRPAGRSSVLNRLEAQWRDEQRHGGPSQAF